MNLLSTTGGSLVWEWHDGSFDRARILPASDGWEITGRHGDTRYVVLLSANYKCRSLEASCGTQTLSLSRTAAGWHDTNAGLIPNTAGIFDLDLGWSALSNTFPIKRLMAQDSREGTFCVLMITEPDLKPQIVRQSYLQRATSWQYANLDSGFTAKLTVDAHGIVADYPGLCHRKDLSA